MKPGILLLICTLLIAAHSNGQDWTTTGNSGTSVSTNFVGTTDSVSLVFRTNNTERMRLGANGSLMLGLTSDNGYKLNISGGLRTTSDLSVTGLRIGKGPGSGTNNSAMGQNAFLNNTTGYANSAFGAAALRYNRQGSTNTAIGYLANGNTEGDSSLVNTVSVGASSRTAGSRGTSIGASTRSGMNGVAIGFSAYSENTGSIAVGYNTQAAGNFGSIVVGTGSSATHIGSMIFGYGLSSTASYQLLIGHTNPGYGVRDVYIGGGVQQSNAASYGPLTIQPTGQSGTNQPGQTIRIAAGKGTGTANPGDIHLMASVPRASGDTLQNLTTSLILKGTTGNVGIGTTTPSAQLHTTGSVRLAGLSLDSTKTRYLVADNNGNLSYRSIPALGGGGSISGTINYLARYISSNSIENSIVYDNGYSVGIGTVSMVDTAFRLFVEKGIRTRRVKVDISSWADHVFETDYDLMPLRELRKFIEANRHLPGVPTAEEVKRDGVDLGDNQAVLLQKVEELTLHLIQLEERLTKLEAENRMLRDKAGTEEQPATAAKTGKKE